MMPDEIELKRDLLCTSDPCPITRLSPYDGAARAEYGDRQRAAIAIGVFDGLHVGHRSLIDALIRDARERGVRSVIVTFDPDPDRVVSAHPAMKLMSGEDRLGSLASTGVDEVLVVPFTKELAALGHEQFFRDVLFPYVDIASIHVGSDFRLGAGGASTVEVIADWGAQAGIEVFGHELVRDDGAAVSASRIRERLAAGDIDVVRRELGRRYMVRGVVSTGRGEGSGMGFPTANISVPSGIQMPADGVYAGVLLVGDEVWPAAVNVGVPPMFSDKPESASLEANLLGFSGDLYGKSVALVFDKRLRPSKVFSSKQELIDTVLGNIEEVREMFGDDGVKLSL